MVSENTSVLENKVIIMTHRTSSKDFGCTSNISVCLLHRGKFIPHKSLQGVINFGWCHFIYHIADVFKLSTSNSSTHKRWNCQRFLSELTEQYHKCNPPI